MRVTNHVYVLSGGHYGADNYGTLGAVYGIRTQNGMILVDCGLPKTGMEMIQGTLDYYEIKDKINYVLITHSHGDHCGNAKYLQDIGAKIVAGEGDVEYLCKAGGFVLFRDTRCEEGFYHRYPAFTPDIIIDKDKELVLDGLTFRFILIPGHSQGSMAIRLAYDGKSMLFVGDSITPLGIQCDSVELGWKGDPQYDPKAQLNSMVKLSEIDTDMILPGHGNICLRNGTFVLRNAAKEAFVTLR